MCPTWPFCSGKFSDTKIIYIHRSIALALFILSGFISFDLSKKSHPSAKWAHWFFGLIILQATLGALTAVFEVPAVISFVHLILSLVSVAVVVVLHDSLDENKEKNLLAPKAFVRDGLLVVLILFFIQSLFGGLVRHVGAGSACGLGVGNLLMCNDLVVGEMAWWPMRAISQLHMFHRLSGMILLIISLPILITAFLHYAGLDSLEAKKARNSAILAVLLLFLQIYSGFYNIASSLAVHATVFHLIMAAALLAFVLKTRLYHIKMERSFYGRIQPSVFSDILELFKPRLAGLVMVTMLIGALLVPGQLYFLDIVISSFLIFMVVASATTLNCWMERDVDAKMERTKDRALPSGRMQPKVALWIGLVMAFVSLPALYFIVNPLTAFLGLVAHLMYLLAYTPLKKHSATALFVGAVPGALPPVMGWTTLTGTMDATAWCLFAILFVWQLPHFLAISIYYRGDYEAADLKIFADQTNFTAIRRDIFLYTIVLMFCALSPAWFAGFGVHYKNSATVLSLLFLAVAVLGFFIKIDEDARRYWARSYFLGSIVYLPLLLGAMLFFK